VYTARNKRIKGRVKRFMPIIRAAEVAAALVDTAINGRSKQMVENTELGICLLFLRD
jgi:hypothetical protein